MREVVIINGPSGVGKSTVSRLLADALPGTVYIRGDDLRGFAPRDARERLGVGATHRAAAVLAKAYLEMGAERIVVDYVFMRHAHVSRFHEAFACPDTPVYMFTLWAPLHVVEARERGRVGRSPLGLAVGECWREFEQNMALLGELVDATTASATQLADAITRSLQRRRPSGGMDSLP